MDHWQFRSLKLVYRQFSSISSKFSKSKMVLSFRPPIWRHTVPAISKFYTKSSYIPSNLHSIPDLWSNSDQFQDLLIGNLHIFCVVPLMISTTFLHNKNFILWTLLASKRFTINFSYSRFLCPNSWMFHQFFLLLWSYISFLGL